MKNVICFLMILAIKSFSFGSEKKDNTFTGKTKISVEVSVDERALRKSAGADGKSQCFKVFEYCYAIDNTYDTVEEESGLYATILVEGFNEIPDKYKLNPSDAIKPPPPGSVCYFQLSYEPARTPSYFVYVTYDGITSYQNGFYADFTHSQLIKKLQFDGICESYRPGRCKQNLVSKGYSCE